MSSAALAALGPVLAAATQAIEAVIRPERVYCAMFSEEMRSVHFHLFPRTTWLTAKYVATHPHSLEISGPHLMDWARRVFQQPIPDTDPDEAFQKMRVLWGEPNKARP